MQYKSIFITGGAGYCGSRLVPQLLEEGYKVSVYDLMLFGSDFLPKENPNLKIIKVDIRDIKTFSEVSKKHDVFIHLACISNDASFVLNESLSTSINMDAFEPMVLAAKKNPKPKKKSFRICLKSPKVSKNLKKAIFRPISDELA